MNTTYDVRIWKTEVYQGARTTTYYVRWTVAGKSWREGFKTSGVGIRVQIGPGLRCACQRRPKTDPLSTAEN
jgi:hypothetical protein